MIKGQKLYFVKVKDGEIKEYEFLNTTTGVPGYVSHTIFLLLKEINNKKYWEVPLNAIVLNPAPKDFWKSNTKVGRLQECYLVFTKIEKAEQALFGYVLPQIITNKQEKADELLKEYQNIISEIGEIEKRIQKSK